MALSPKLSNASGANDGKQIRITHPFHPLRGQSFRLVATKQRWGEHRVTFQCADNRAYSVLANWTDAVPTDPYLSVGKGRSQFRVEDLLALANLLAAGKQS